MSHTNSYYTAKSLRFRMPRWMPMTVTTIQLSQMVLGSGVLGYVFWLRFVAGRYCQISDTLLYFGVAMYISYFLLFGHFFFQAYLRKRTSNSGKSEAASTANGHNGKLMSNGTSHQNGNANGHNGKTARKSTKKAD